MPQLSLSLFGAFQVTRDGQPLEGFRSQKVKALLAYLALETHKPHARDELLALLWPEEPTDAARNNLRVALSRLKSTLGAQCLMLNRDTAQFNSHGDLMLDVALFTRLLAEAQAHPHHTLDRCRACSERLRQAVALYRGDLLAGFFVKGSLPFEEWLTLRREVLHHHMLSALTTLATYHERRNEHALVKTYATRQLALEPWREGAHRQLMRAFAASGDRPAALAQYETCRQILAAELGVAPERETSELFEAIQANTFHVSPPTATTPHNLPAPLTTFVGRAQETAQLVERLGHPTPRLVTLVGAGGMGKTRLALEAAQQLLAADEFRDGIWWIQLASVADPTLVPQTLAVALGQRDEGQRSTLQQLRDFLRHKEALLLLDNCEHLLEACAQLVSTLLSACPRLWVLTTSREALGVDGEHICLVPPLALPDAHITALAALSEAESVRLFVQRANAQTHFTLTAQNAVAVAQICRRLDGIPLAIELAAARVKLLSPREIVARLADCFKLLTLGERNAPPRHQTLHAAIDWSYELLSVPERTLFQRLSVFVGEFDVEAAEQVTGDKEEVLDLLTQLVDKSLVVADPNHPTTCLRLLETLREYARDKLAETDEQTGWWMRHLSYYAALAASAEPHINSPHSAEWLARLDANADNLRVALERSATIAPQVGLPMACTLGRYWEARGRFIEGRDILTRLLGAADGIDVHIRARGLLWAGRLNVRLAELPTGKAQLNESLALLQALDDKPNIALALNTLGMASSANTEHGPARRFYEASLTVYRAANDQRGMGAALNNLGVVTRVLGEYEAAQRYYHESLALKRELKDRRGVAMTLTGLGEVELHRCDFVAAQRLLLEALALHREAGDRQGIAYTLSSLSQVLWLRGELAAAQRLLSECLELQNTIGDRVGRAYALHFQGLFALACSDEKAAERWLMEGLRLARTLDNAGTQLLCIEGLARVAAARRRLEQATLLWGAAAAVRQTITLPPLPFLREANTQAQTAAHAQLGEVSWTQHWAEGHAMSLAQVAAYVMELM
jgi:predicted ATPase